MHIAQYRVSVWQTAHVHYRGWVCGKLCLRNTEGKCAANYACAIQRVSVRWTVHAQYRRWVCGELCMCNTEGESVVKLRMRNTEGECAVNCACAIQRVRVWLNCACTIQRVSVWWTASNSFPLANFKLSILHFASGGHIFCCVNAFDHYMLPSKAVGSKNCLILKLYAAFTTTEKEAR